MADFLKDILGIGQSAVDFVSRKLREYKQPTTKFLQAGGAGPAGQIATETSTGFNATRKFTKDAYSLGSNVGKSITALFDQPRFNRIQDAERAQMNANLARAKQLTNAGQKEAAKALLRKNITTGQRLSNESQRRIDTSTQGMKDTLVSGGRTIESILAAPIVSTGAGLAGAAAAAGLTAAVHKATGKDVREGFETGFAEGARIQGITRFTNPIISKAIANVGVKSFLGDQVVGRTISGIGNAIEDEIISFINGEKRSGTDRAASFAIGSALYGNDKIVSAVSKKLGIGREQVKKVASEMSKAVKQAEDTTREYVRKPVRWIENADGSLTRDMRYGKQTEMIGGKYKGKPPMEAFGAFGGIETYYDENDKTWKVRYNPEKAVAAIAIMGGVRAIKGSGASKQILDTIREAIASGDEEAAKALHADVAKEYKLPDFETIKSQVSDALDKETKAASKEVSDNFGEYGTLVNKMKNFLRISGENKSDTGELFREHIPRKVFGVSSDEVAAALGKTESEFMADLTKDLEMLGNPTARPQAIAGLKTKITQLKSVADKLDPAFYNVVKAWDNKLKVVSAAPTTATMAKATKQAQMAKAKEALAFDKEWTKHVFESTNATITQKKKLDNAIKTIEQSIKENSSDGLPPPTTPDMPLNQQPGLWDRIKNVAKVVVKESRAILNDMGTNGKEAAKRIDNYFNDAERMAGGAVADYNTSTKSLTTETVERLNKALDGQDVKLNKAEQKILGQLRGQLDQYAGEAQKARMEIRRPDGTKVEFQPRENYLPHMVDMDKLKAQRDAVIQHLVESKQLPDVTTASNFVNDIINGGSVGDAYHKYFPNALPNRYGNLEMARVIDWPKEVLRYDRMLLPDYFQSAANRIQMSYQFGPDNELVDKLLTNIAQEGGDSQLADRIIKKNLGILREDRVLSQGVGAIKQVQAATKLGLALISNAGQSTNTATEFGIMPTLKSIFSAFKPESQDFALRTGATLDSAVKELEDEVMGTGGLSKITAPGFGAVEKFNRIVAANTGKEFVNKRFQDLLANTSDTTAMKDLEKMGINVKEALARGELTTEELLKAGQKAVNITQFKTRPIDLPPTWSSAFGRLVTQFKSFSYKHGQFIANEVLKPAIQDKNFAPLLRYTVLGLVVGEGISDLKAFVRRRERPTNPIERGMDNLASVGGMGLLQDAINAAGRGSEAMLSFIAGPTVSDISKAAGGVGLALQGKPKTLARFILGNIPVVGQPIANTLIPPVGAYKNRTPDLIQEAIGMTPEQSVQDFLKDKQAYSQMDEADVKAQLATVRKQKKDVINAKGMLGFGMSDEEKNAKLDELTREENALKNASIFKDINHFTEMPEENGYQRAQKIEAKFKIADKVLTDTDRQPDEQLYILTNFLGMNEYDAGYYQVARDKEDTKVAFVVDQLDQLPEDVDTFSFLSTLRYKVGGDMIASDGVISQLYEDGYISKDESKALKNLKYDEKTGKITQERAASGSGSSKQKTLAKNALGDLSSGYGKLANVFGDITPPKLSSSAPAKSSASKPLPIDKLFTRNIEKEAQLSYTVPKAKPLPIEKLFGSPRPLNISKAKAEVQALAKASQGAGRGTPKKLSRSFYRAS